MIWGITRAQYLHLLIEAIKLASADRAEYTCAENPPITGLLSKGYAAEQRKRIGYRAGVGGGERYTKDKLPNEILPGNAAEWMNECTTHFDVVDGEGNAVAVTQSLGSGFGSGVALGETGMFLNNFMNWFDLLPESPNAIGSHKQIEMCMSSVPSLEGREAVRGDWHTGESRHLTDDGADGVEPDRAWHEYPSGDRGTTCAG